MAEVGLSASWRMLVQAALPPKMAKGSEQQLGMGRRKKVRAREQLAELERPRKVTSSKLEQELQNRSPHADPRSGTGIPVPFGDQGFWPLFVPVQQHPPPLQRGTPAGRLP